MIVNATEARRTFFELLEKVRLTHQPAIVTHKSGSVVLVSKDDWDMQQSIVRLCKAPGLLEELEVTAIAPDAMGAKEWGDEDWDELTADVQG